jgi:hypothetical protein
MTSLIQFNNLKENTTYYLYFGLIRGAFAVSNCTFKVLERCPDCYVVDFGGGKLSDLVLGWVYEINELVGNADSFN